MSKNPHALDKGATRVTMVTVASLLERLLISCDL